MREVELWNRAVREEEKIAVEKDAKENGEKKMQQIKESMAKKQEKEAKDRAALSTANESFLKYKVTAMAKRNEEWEKKKKEFIITKMDELKEIILQEANHELMLEENRVR
jgi:hypothetical protein